MIGQWLAWFVPEDERVDLTQRLARDGSFSKVFQFEDWVVAGVALPPPRSLVELPRALREDRGYLFSYCDDPRWASVDPAWVERLLEDPEHLDQLPGDFSFARLQAGGATQVARSCGGQGPWHFSCAKGRVVVSTRLDWVATTQRLPIELDPLVCVMTGMGLRTALLPRSVLRGTNSLRPGHAVATGPRGQHCAVRYFRPEPLTLPPPCAEHQRFVGTRLRELLFRKIDTDLAKEGNLVLYSGGLDSSLLVGIATALGIPLHATTLLPQRDDSVFAREVRFTDLLTSRFSFHDRVIATPELFDELVRCEGLIATGYFGGLPRRLLQRGGAFTATMIGYRADEIFGLLRGLDWINATPFFALPSLLKAQPKDLRLGSRWARRRRIKRHPLPLPVQLHAMFTPAIREEYRDYYAAEMRQSRGEPPGFRLVQFLRYRDFSGSYAEAAAVQGMRAVLPFVQREVLELGFATHPRELFQHRMAKAPLRLAAQGLLPAELLNRADKGNWNRFPRKPIPAGGALHATLAPFLDKAWPAQHSGIDSVSAGTLLYVRQLCIAREKLNNERNAFFER